MEEGVCNVRCKRYPMVVREFRLLRGEIWDFSFSSRLGKAASKLYREIYGKSPNRRRSNPLIAISSRAFLVASLSRHIGN